MTVFKTKHLVRFADCDPAGIAYYPRYFELFSRAIEDFFGRALDLPYDQLHMKKGWGVPLINVTADFINPSRMGDELIFEVRLEKIGNTSFIFNIDAMCGEQRRATCRMVMVLRDMNAEGPDIGLLPIPDELRGKMEKYLVDKDREAAQ